VKFRLILSEAWRNFLSGATHGLSWVVAFTVLMTVLAASDVISQIQIVDRTNEFRTVGGSIQVLHLDKGISGARCDAIQHTLNARAGGALRKAQDFSVSTMPNTNVTAWESTAGLIPLIAPTAQSAERATGVWFSTDQAELLGLRTGDSFGTTDRGYGVVGGVYEYPDDGRKRDLGFASVAIVPPTGVFDQCWLEIWPHDDDSEALLLTTVLPAADVNSLEMSQLNGKFGAQFDPLEMLNSRATRWVKYVAAVFGVVLGAVVVWLRRLEFVSVLHAQIRKAHAVWQFLVETLLWLIPAVIVTATLLLGIITSHGLAHPIEFWTVTLVPLLVGSLATIVGALSTLACLHENMLFRFFKGR